jgi:hypothetical protein
MPEEIQMDQTQVLQLRNVFSALDEREIAR